jgi:hypothetical protein
MLCRQENFQSFMSEFIGGFVDEESTADELCKQCGIESRSELNGNLSAQNKFDELVAEYENWSKNDQF